MGWPKSNGLSSVPTHSATACSSSIFGSVVLQASASVRASVCRVSSIVEVQSARRLDPGLDAPRQLMSREAESFRRISAPTCWSAAPRSCKRGATTSRSDRPPPP